MWLLTKVGIQKISTKLNPFWRDIFLNWSTISEGEEVNGATHVKCQPIWSNPSITNNGKVVLNEKWQKKGYVFINDIMKRNGNGLMSVEELGLKYQITNACMFYNSLLSCLPRFWKHLIQNSARLLWPGPTWNNLIKLEIVLSHVKLFITYSWKKYTERPINSQNKWEKLLNINEVNWEFVYILSNDCTLDNTLKMFQYKLLHRTIPTNTFLYKCRLVETKLCAFCGETRETILHLFCDYNIVNNIWLKIYSVWAADRVWGSLGSLQERNTPRNWKCRLLVYKFNSANYKILYLFL